MVQDGPPSCKFVKFHQPVDIFTRSPMVSPVMKPNSRSQNQMYQLMHYINHCISVIPNHYNIIYS